VLTNVMVCAYHSIVNYEIMINYSGSVSQDGGEKSRPVSGLRILARIIAHDLLIRRLGHDKKSDVRENNSQTQVPIDEDVSGARRNKTDGRSNN